MLYVILPIYICIYWLCRYFTVAVGGLRWPGSNIPYQMIASGEHSALSSQIPNTKYIKYTKYIPNIPIIYQIHQLYPKYSITNTKYTNSIWQIHHTICQKHQSSKVAFLGKLSYGLENMNTAIYVILVIWRAKCIDKSSKTTFVHIWIFTNHAYLICACICMDYPCILHPCMHRPYWYWVTRWYCPCLWYCGLG